MPTSLIYIVLSTRGYTPWRPDAVMSTTRGANKSLRRVFKGRRERARRRQDCAAFPYEPTPIAGRSDSRGRPHCQQEQRTLAGAHAAVPDFACVTTRYPRPGPGILTRFPFDRRGDPKTTRLPNGTDLSLRIDSPMSNCCSHGTFPHVGLQSSQLNICYYHQDLH